MRYATLAIGLIYLASLTTACTTREALIGTGAAAAGVAAGYIASEEGVGHHDDRDDHRDRDRR